MRRKRNARILFWPIATAVAVIVLLIGAPRLRQQLGLPLFEAPIANQSTNPHSAQMLRGTPKGTPPKPMLNTDQRTTVTPSPYPSSVEPANNFTLNQRLDESTIRLEPADVLPPPVYQPVANARLMAPVRDHREELAGLGVAVNDATHALELIPPFPNRSSSLVSFPGDQQGGALLAADADHSRRGQQMTGDRRTGNRSLLGVGRDDSAPISMSISDQDGQQLSSTAEHPLDTARQDGLDPTGETRSKPAGIAWPRTPALEESLSRLATRSETRDWIEQTRAILWQLQSLPSLQHPAAAPLIEQLYSYAEAGLLLGESLNADRASQEETLRAAHAVLRRAVVWRSIHELTLAPPPQPLDASWERLQAAIEIQRQRAEATGDQVGWVRYLMLDDLAAMQGIGDLTERRILAQRLLSRVDWAGLSSEQAAWLADPSVYELIAAVRPWAETPIDYVDLLLALERLESDALDMRGIDVAAAVQTLRFSDYAPAVQVARSINDYYRHANLRMAVGADLIQRLLPEIPQRTTAIRQTLVGVPVRGTGVIDSRLAIELVPTRGAWNLRLATLGSIRGKTGSQQWPVSLANRSSTQFEAVTPIYVDADGVTLGETTADVDSQVRLNAMRTEFDGFPVIESLVRGIATARYNESAPAARRQSEQMTRNQLRTTVGQEVQKEIDRASLELSERLLGPLGRLRLDPLVVDLDTSDSRLTARYRLAGDWQVAAFTPRPRAISDSVLSLQVHQSMLNNTFEQLAPEGEPKPIVEVRERILSLFGMDQQDAVEIPAEVKIQFASTRPITVEIEEDILWLTLRVVCLTDDRDLNLTHFVVRAAYRPVIDGMQTRLEREGALRVEGPRMGMRERVPVRAIFNKVLDKDRPIPLIASKFAEHPAAEGMTVGMLQLTDGWLCLAIHPEQRSSIANGTQPVKR